MQENADCLIEIGLEELPPKDLGMLIKAFAQGFAQELQQLKLYYGIIQGFVTPRRLAILITDLDAQQAEQSSMLQGPPLTIAFGNDGKPTAAGLGFARKCGVDVSELTTHVTDQGEWLVYNKICPAKDTVTILPQIFSKLMEYLPITKAMRWGSYDVAFVRPVHWIVFLYGADIVTMNCLTKSSGRISYGHRVHHPRAITLHTPREYCDVLRKAYVIADFKERRDKIQADVINIATQHNVKAIIDDKLLDEVTGLVEWPVALFARFDPKFLKLPDQVLITVMQQHQRYFPLCDEQGHLSPYFVTVANIESRKPQQVVTGNERVMRARLADAAFFFAMDKQRSLESRIQDMQRVVFQATLGSLYDKSRRVAYLAKSVAKLLGVDQEQAQRAASLMDCDLLTSMVIEFPSLQGIMGYHYAMHDGESKDIAIALRDHYLPRFYGDQLPSTNLANVLALADRLDTLIGMFGIKKIPNGAKDPYKLRRAALGVVRLCIEGHMEVDIMALLEYAAMHYKQDFASDVPMQVHNFILERLKVWFQGQGFDVRLVEAVLACQARHLCDVKKRLCAIRIFLQHADAKIFLTIGKRVNKIILSAMPEDVVIPLNADLLCAGDELQLHQLLLHNRPIIERYIQTGDYLEALRTVIQFATPVDDFFTHVTVMVNETELRQNRLALLCQLKDLLFSIADWSLL